MAYETLNSKEVYNGAIFSIERDEITLPNNKTAFRESLIHGGAAAILPIDKDGNIILVKQYRHPVKSMVLEMPAGCLEKNEDPMECGKRELEEEIGYKSNDFKYLMKFTPAVGYSSEVIHIYIAKDLVESEQNLDEDEFVEIEKFTFDEIMDMVAKGIMSDSKTIAAILYAKQLNLI